MRDITKLHPELQQKIALLLAECKTQGLNVLITDCVRTVAEQDALYAQGRTKPGNIVTNAKGSSYSSMHQWGIACDFCRNVKGKEYDDSDGFFGKVGKIAQGIGLEWGGAWKSFIDKPHLQLLDWGTNPTLLKSIFKTPEAFRASWPAESSTPSEPCVVKNPYPEPTINLYAGKRGDTVRWLQWELNQSEKAGLTIDGVFGTATEKAVKAFQKKYKLNVDGNCGKTTRAKLKEIN